MVATIGKEQEPREIQEKNVEEEQEEILRRAFRVTRGDVLKRGGQFQDAMDAHRR